MASPQSVPFPYREARTSHLTPHRHTDNVGFTYYEEESSLPVIEADRYAAWRRLELLFPDAYSVEKDSPFGLPARMEFFWDEVEDTRGVAFFDVQGRLIVHALHALLGYNGSGPRFSQQIMEHLGVSHETFEAIQAEVEQQRPYQIVLSREPHGFVDDIEVVTYMGGVTLDWEWWRTR